MKNLVLKMKMFLSTIMEKKLEKIKNVYFFYKFKTISDGLGKKYFLMNKKLQKQYLNKFLTQKKKINFYLYGM